MTTYAPRGSLRVPIDPRIRERRLEVQREAGRRRLHRVVVIGVLAALTVALGAAMFSPLLDVDAIAVSGVGGGRVAAVRDAAGIAHGDPTLFVDTGKVEDRIESLPWVGHARASRQLPGTIRITITPRRAVGWAPAADGRAAIIDARGIVVDSEEQPPAGLPQLAPRAASVPGLAARVADALPADLRRLATRVDVADGDAVVTLSWGPQLRMGDGSALRAKGRAALAVIEARSGTPTTYVDVRVPSAPATG
jgi:cell division septal protein FtsQ